MNSEADEIASLVLKQFDRLPAKRKPPVRDNGTHEWVPLSGIVARGTNGKATCLALATGMKCLPASRLSLANGVAVHDWHAEILAIRAFNQFILEECRNIALHGRASNFLRLRTEEELAAADKSAFHGQPFSWKDGITLHMYCSEAPCGDASMELTMAAQDDASPWDIPAPQPASVSGSAGSGSGSEPPALLGRGYFSQLGVVRRKPARGDAPPTLSKSCSDKLALKQCTSLLSSLTSLLVCPDGVYLRTLVLPESQHSEAGCRRSFSADEGRGGRMHPVAGKQWSGGYAFRPFEVQTTRREFSYSRRSVAARADKTAASNLAVAWARNGLEESLIGGVLQGRKQFDLRGATPVSRRKMWSLATEVAALVGMSCVAIQSLLRSSTYKSVKEGELLSARRQVKSEARARALAGWVRNTDDNDFRIEHGG